MTGLASVTVTFRARAGLPLTPPQAGCCSGPKQVLSPPGLCCWGRHAPPTLLGNSLVEVEKLLPTPKEVNKL